MTSTTLRASLVPLVGSLLFACSSSSTSTDEPSPMCNSITIVPAIVNVYDAVTGAPICDPSITVPSAEEGGAPQNVGSSCSGDLGGCPQAGPDGGSLACTFAVAGIDELGGSYPITVSAPGYASKVVTNVHNGEGGCVAAVPASQISVSLTPSIEDGGTNG